MKALKEKGLEELNVLRNRVGRQYGLGRIDQETHDRLKEKLAEIETIIETCKEEED